MQGEEFVMLRDFIHERSGIFFAENKTYLLKNRLVKRMADLGIKSFRDYFYRVKYDTSLGEFKELMNLITTNETSFFRNVPQLLSFSHEALPLLVKEKSEAGGVRTIRVWSAGCSTGEEPYTLAMMIMEELASLADWKVEVIANDISEQVLMKARQGEYSGITLRNVKPATLDRFFDKNGDTFRVKPQVKALVKFSHINLNEPRQMSMHSGFDAIFCRNVMIYFSDGVKRQIVRGFYNSLRPGGYFYIGHSETLHGVSKAFKLVYFKNALVYQKEAVDSTAAAPDAAARLNCTAKDTGGARRAMDLLSKIRPMTVTQ
jgi:chemotaxis protein methyltransferase CheR